MEKPAVHLPQDQYLATVNRSEELGRLQAQAAKRKSMLVFGPEGVGKTRLLRHFIQTEPYALYVPHSHTPKELIHFLLASLRAREKRGSKLPNQTEALNTSSLKGIVRQALEKHSYVLVLDHVAAPSRAVANVIKEFNYYGQHPIIFAARSPHMEDIGTLLPICVDRSERLELKNLPAAIALEFAKQEVRQLDLEADNLETTLQSIVEWSAGNPGSILRMLKMAALPSYRINRQIKAHILYLDFLMNKQ